VDWLDCPDSGIGEELTAIGLALTGSVISGGGFTIIVDNGRDLEDCAALTMNNLRETIKKINSRELHTLIPIIKGRS